MNPDVRELLNVFIGQFEKNLKLAYTSGALSGDENPVMVAKVVLFLSANGVKPLSKEGKEILNNLKYFI